MFNHIEDVTPLSSGNLPLLCIQHPKLLKERWAKELALQIDNEIIYLNDPKAKGWIDD